MKKLIEGTFILEGIIEGKINSNNNTVDDWIILSNKIGFEFELEITGNSFNLLPVSKTYHTKNFSDAPEIIIKNLLNELSRKMGENGNIFSTLRSRQYLSQKERQTIYLCNENTLEIDIQQRDTDVQTFKINEKLIKQLKVIKYIIYIFILSCTIAWGYFLNFWPLSTTSLVLSKKQSNLIAIEINHYTPYIEISEKNIEVSNKGKHIILKLKKAEAYPSNHVINNKTILSMTNVLSRLAIEDLIRGEINIEIKDKKNDTIDIFSRPLNFNSTNITKIRIPYNKELFKIIISP